eukprot:6212277-Pleurochrysis_carterae.AAC.4
MLSLRDHSVALSTRHSRSLIKGSGKEQSSQKRCIRRASLLCAARSRARRRVGLVSLRSSCVPSTAAARPRSRRRQTSRALSRARQAKRLQQLRRWSARALQPRALAARAWRRCLARLAQ